MQLSGKLITESPIYRGNARKTLFTRDGDGTHRLVSLAGEISGTAQTLMDAFTGRSKNGKNIGLLDALWQRLYGEVMPDGLIERVDCKLQKDAYPRNQFFDMRMGIKLDEDRWAAEANANYKMETVLRRSTFDFNLSLRDNVLKKGENQDRMLYILEEMRAGRFWFGAGKSKGLGRLRLEIKLPFSAPKTPPAIQDGVNHLQIDLAFGADNPLLVGWSWGKVDPQTAAFPDIEARLLIEGMKGIPEPIRNRLEMALGGAILNPEDWKEKLAEYLPRITAIWLKERSAAEESAYILPSTAVSKLGKGKHALNKKLLNKIKPFADQPFASLEAADEAFREALGKKANMAKRVTDLVEHTQSTRESLDEAAWESVADGLGLERSLGKNLADKIDDELAMVKVLTPAIQAILPSLYDQVDQQIRLIQSDAWVDEEIKSREEHLLIKEMLKEGKITEYQWNDPGMVPEGIRSATWREFLDAHSRVQLRHMLNPTNLNKSITNDRNHIEFLKTYRDRVRQELSQPVHIDFRAGGVGNREISRKYGKPYDTVFMRMLSWAPSSREAGAWEIYVPGSTIKGAFRKRATQVLRTLWGETRKTASVLDRLFGAQGQRGMIFFSDAYLADPNDPSQAFCSMDGIRMDPTTGKPIDASKRDYLYAYGDSFRFQLRIDLADIRDADMELIGILFHLIDDFRRGEVPIGGDKTAGFGWAEVDVDRISYRCADGDRVAGKLFGDAESSPDGIWRRIELTGDAAARAVRPNRPIDAEGGQTGKTPPSAKGGFISHRAFGGHCGSLWVEAALLTPLNIQESGQPSFSTDLPEGPVNGWDVFSMSPPEAERRGDERVYALPGRSIKGMIRNIYAIASDSKKDGVDIARLNPADRLFGWVGNGPNQALMGRVSVGFARFDALETAPSWFKVPYPYGNWQFVGGAWKKQSGAQAKVDRVADHWRLFPHAPLAPAVETMESFSPDTVAASYFRAIMPGERVRFRIRFWNLEDEELARLLWSVALEPGLAHKIGNHRYLGFGSLRLTILPESHLIDWAKRYAGEESDWQIPLSPEKVIDPKAVRNIEALRRALDAQHL